MTPRTAPSWFRWSIFPIGFLGTGAAAIALIESGTEPGLAVLPLIFATAITVAVLEQVLPYREDWRHSKDDIATDAAHGLLSLPISTLAQPLAALVIVPVATWLAAHTGGGIWPGHWPLWGQYALALVVGELATYWVHRLQHETDLLWRFHSIHHSVPRLYWLNALRFHPVDFALNGVAATAILVPLGVTPEATALFLLGQSVHGYFQHANLQMRLGPLNWIFSMAELHRWHHSPRVEEMNHNYGQTMIVWDIVFGTRWLPADREPDGVTGIDDLPGFPMTWWRQILAPFRWAATRRESG